MGSAGKLQGTCAGRTAGKVQAHGLSEGEEGGGGGRELQGTSPWLGVGVASSGAVDSHGALTRAPARTPALQTVSAMVTAALQGHVKVLGVLMNFQAQHTSAE